jgi:CheY-like chemotaxis protein
METIVLMIDDDKDDQEIFQQELHRFNPSIKFLSAYNGEEGLELLQKNPPHYIFLDINMPVMNGIDALKLIKQDESLKNIPVIIFSTSDGRAYKKMALNLGAENYFTKPTALSGLHKMFDQIFTSSSV